MYEDRPYQIHRLLRAQRERERENIVVELEMYHNRQDTHTQDIRYPLFIVLFRRVIITIIILTMYYYKRMQFDGILDCMR
jgi:hypothetical protein